MTDGVSSSTTGLSSCGLRPAVVAVPASIPDALGSAIESRLTSNQRKGLLAFPAEFGRYTRATVHMRWATFNWLRKTGLAVGETQRARLTPLGHDVRNCIAAQGIKARTGGDACGSIADESPTPQGDAPDTPCHPDSIKGDT